MLRIAILVSAVLAMALAFALYAITYDTRSVAERVRGLERQIATQESAIAVLAAEQAALTRPEQIEPLARRHLQLQPLAPEQVGDLADLPWRTPPTTAPNAASRQSVPGSVRPAEPKP
jgi:cell division protein FtsL